LFLNGESPVAAQRIVITSPWKLGLFVFLLVVGTGFGLIYAWLRLFGGALELDNSIWLKHFYTVCGAVAGLGLTGYLSVVAAARPLEGVMRGKQQRERLLKAFGKIKNPADANLEDFDAVPALAHALERWQQDSINASDAQTTLHTQREAISQLASRVRELGDQDSLMARQNDDELSPLVDSINLLVEQVRNASGQPAAAAAASRNGDGDFGAARSAWQSSSPELRQHQAQLLGFARSIQQSSQLLSSHAQMAPADGSSSGRVSPVGQLSARSVERLRELRHKIEALAEESSRLAIQAALHVSRLGESGGGLVPVTEEIRAVSTRYQRLVPDLRLCENDAEMILAMAGDSGSATGGGSSGNQHLAAALGQDAGGIQQVANGLAAALRRLAGAFGEPIPSAAVEPVALVATPIVQTAPAAAPVAQQAPAAAPVPPVARRAPAAAPVVEEEVFELDALGGHELDADGQPIYDLMEFGAAEV
jgi:hypothetical protein